MLGAGGSTIRYATPWLRGTGAGIPSGIGRTRLRSASGTRGVGRRHAATVSFGDRSDGIGESSTGAGCGVESAEGEGRRLHLLRGWRATPECLVVPTGSPVSRSHGERWVVGREATPSGPGPNLCGAARDRDGRGRLRPRRVTPARTRPRAPRPGALRDDRIFPLSVTRPSSTLHRRRGVRRIRRAARAPLLSDLLPRRGMGTGPSRSIGYTADPRVRSRPARSVASDSNR